MLAHQSNATTPLYLKIVAKGGVFSLQKAGFFRVSFFEKGFAETNEQVRPRLRRCERAGNDWSERIETGNFSISEGRHTR